MLMRPGLMRAGLWFAVLMLLARRDASAAALASLGASVGLFAALLAVLAFKSWPANVASAGLSAATVLALVATAAWLRRGGRGFLPAPAGAGAPGRHAGRCVPATDATRILPEGFDQAGLLCAAMQDFVRLQAAWDACDISALRALTTNHMLEELCAQLPERGAGVNRTEVLTLHAELLAFEELGSAWLASIEFSGTIREHADRGAAPFRELWMLARAKNGDCVWRLARQQALF